MSKELTSVDHMSRLKCTRGMTHPITFTITIPLLFYQKLTLHLGWPYMDLTSRMHCNSVLGLWFASYVIGFWLDDLLRTIRYYSAGAKTRGSPTKARRFSRTSCSRNIHHWVYPNKLGCTLLSGPLCYCVRCFPHFHSQREPGRVITHPSLHLFAKN